MFNERKLAKIVDIVTGSKTQETKSKKAKDKTLCPVKITGSEKSGNVYLYSWEGIKADGTFDSNIGKSGNNKKAYASVEIGKSVSAPTFQVGDTCMLRRSSRGCILVSGGSNGASPEFETTLHEHAIPIVSNTGQSNEQGAT